VSDAATTPSVVPRRRRPSSLFLTWLYLRTLLFEFRWSLIALSILVLLGAFIGMTTRDETGRPISFALAYYNAWMSLFAQPQLPPNTWYLGVLHMVYPVLGISLIGEGVVRLALLIVSKRQGEKEWMKVMASTYRDHTILCGLGNLGIRVLQQLLAQQLDVVVLEKEADGKFVSQGKALGVPILIHDMKEDQALLDAGIQYARSIIVCTNDDIANLEVAIDSRRLNPKIRVVMRLFDQDIAQKVSGALAIDAIFSASTLAAPMVAALSSGSKVLGSLSIAGVPYAACELKVDDASGLCGLTVGQVEQNKSARALALLRDGQHVPPPLAMHELESGDLLIMCAPTRNLPSLTGARM
jgi:Trk K+ transport system NAD-binding subunit